MDDDVQQLLFTFKSRKNAYLFYDDLLHLIRTEQHKVRLLGLALAYRSARGQVRLERAMLLRGNGRRSSIAHGLTHYLPPRHSALVVVVAGDADSILRAIAALYDISPLKRASCTPAS